MASMKQANRYESFEVTQVTMTKVFGWMFYGLLLTFGSALGLYLSACNGLISVDAYFMVIGIAAVSYFIYSFIAIFAMARTKSKTTSIVLYSIYALLLGALLSSIFVTYEIGSIVYALGITSVIFGIMALYGYFTKRDLSGFGSVLFMILLGCIFITLVNMIIQLFNPSMMSGLTWVISYIMLGVIIGYVAFDIQSVKKAARCGGLPSSLPIFLAFNLYTDFIYIFIRIIQLVGEAKN